MGNFLYGNDPKLSPAMVLMAGPNGAGKSCLACALCQGGDTGSFPGNIPQGKYYPTNGPSECLVGEGKLRLVENGGGSESGLARMNVASFSDAWGCICLVFVVDATERDAGKIRAARAMLEVLVESQLGCNKPVVVVAAKSDIQDAMSTTEVFDKFSLQGFSEGRPFKVVAASAMPDALQGLEELLEYLTAVAKR